MTHRIRPTSACILPVACMLVAGCETSVAPPPPVQVAQSTESVGVVEVTLHLEEMNHRLKIL